MSLFSVKHPLRNADDEFGGGFGDAPPQHDQDHHPAGSDNKKRLPFANQLRRIDSLTTFRGYINEIREVSKGERTLIFISISKQNGSERNGEEWQTRYVNVDVLAGSTLHRTLKIFAGTYSEDTGGRPFGEFEVRNLDWSADTTDGRTYLNSRGVLETVKFGYLEH